MSILTLSPAWAKEPVLHPGDLVAMCGDSITEQAKYSVFVATYLAACQPVPDIEVVNFGVGGAYVNSFLESRLSPHVVSLKPDVVTLFYGMNDSGKPIADFSSGMAQVIQKLKAAGVRDFVIGSPGVVDTFTYTKTTAGGNPEVTATRNGILKKLSGISQEIARENGFAFAEVHQSMSSVMEQAKAKFGQEYPFCGPDGVHPFANGHLVMAYSFLKALGCDGDIAQITVDLKNNHAEATQGHKVVSYADGRLALESSRYPFCFVGDPKLPSSSSGMLEFIPFNRDLNRFMLVVKNSPAPAMKLTWGEQSRVYPTDQLARGVNLAADFLNNPFSRPFAELEEAVRSQQTIQLQLVGPNSLFDAAAKNQKKYPEEGTKALAEAVKAVTGLETVLNQETLRHVHPVLHTIVIEPAP